MKTKEVTNQKILIMGIGWLGLPLALKLKDLGFQISGTTTNHNKKLRLEKEWNIHTSVFELPKKFLDNSEESQNKHFFKDIDTLILNTPPQKHLFPDRYIIEEFLTWLKDEIEFKGKIIFISSTSVYGPNLGAVDEHTPPSPVTIGGYELLSAENFLAKHFLNYCIIRPGGLIGGERHPIKFLQGKTNVAQGNSFLHLVYREDLIDLILKVLNNPAPKIINAFSPYEKTKKEYYIKMAKKFNLTPPEYQLVDQKLEYTKIDASLFEKILAKAPRFPEDFEFESELFT